MKQLNSLSIWFIIIKGAVCKKCVHNSKMSPDIKNHVNYILPYMSLTKAVQPEYSHSESKLLHHPPSITKAGAVRDPVCQLPLSYTVMNDWRY